MALGPPNKNTEWMAEALNVAAQIHMAMRASNGMSRAAITTPPMAHNQAMASAAARTEGCNSIRFENGAAQRRLAEIARDIAGNEITRQVRIGQVE